MSKEKGTQNWTLLGKRCNGWSISLILCSTIVSQRVLWIYVCICIWQIMFINNQTNCCCKTAASYWLFVHVSDVEKLCLQCCVCLLFCESKGIRWGRVKEYGSRAGTLAASHIYPLCAGLTLGCKGQHLGSGRDEELLEVNSADVLHAWNVLSWPWEISVRRKTLQTTEVSCQTDHLRAALWLFL